MTWLEHVVVRVVDLPQPAPGSIIFVGCRRCGKPVWASGATIAQLLRDPQSIVVTCTHCLDARVRWLLHNDSSHGALN